MSKPIHLLRRGQCRFAVTPHSALSHLFCAEPVEHEKSSYCAHHAEICFDRRSPEQRRVDAEACAAMRERRRAATGCALSLPARVLSNTASTLIDGDAA